MSWPVSPVIRNDRVGRPSRLPTRTWLASMPSRPRRWPTALVDVARLPEPDGEVALRDLVAVRRGATTGAGGGRRARRRGSRAAAAAVPRSPTPASGRSPPPPNRGGRGQVLDDPALAEDHPRTEEPDADHHLRRDPGHVDLHVGAARSSSNSENPSVEITPNTAAPRHTAMWVRSPAGCSLTSRSAPTTPRARPPPAAATPLRRRTSSPSVTRTASSVARPTERGEAHAALAPAAVAHPPGAVGVLHHLGGVGVEHPDESVEGEVQGSSLSSTRVRRSRRGRSGPSPRRSG